MECRADVSWVLTVLTGIASAQVLPIVGGEPALEGEWSDTAAVANAGVVNCTGVLIAPDVVLTAGHCGWGITHVVLDSTNHRVNGELITVSDVVIHPEHLTTFDVALAFLDRDATRAEPRALALDCIVEDHLDDDAVVAITGFGATDVDAQRTSANLHVAAAPVGDADCGSLERGCNPAVSPGGELIAGGDGVDSCAGDSGGPAYLLTPYGDFLIGITSRAAAPATSLCGDGGIYVRVDAVADWIEAEAGITLERPDCDAFNRAPRPGTDPLSVFAGVSTAIPLEAHDPDAGDTHRWALVEGPETGQAILGETGLLSYWAPPGFAGSVHVVVRVTDDGDPPLSKTAVVPIEVQVPRPSGGCATVSGASGWLWMLGLLAWRRRP